MRIHELAKEINVQSSDIIDVLKGIDKDKDYKAASGIKDEDIPKVKASLIKSGKYVDKSQPEDVKAKQEKQSAQPKPASGESVKAEPKAADEKPSEMKAASPASGRTEGAKSREAESKTAELQGSAKSGSDRQAKTADGGEKKSHITQVYNPQNSSRGRDNRGYNRDGRDNNRGGHGGFNRDNRDNNRGGQGGYNRDNRDNNRGGQGGFNRDNRDNNRGGQGGYNRDNRDNNRGGQGGYNRDNRDNNRGGQGGFNRDNRDNNRSGQGGFNRDNRDNNRGGQGGFNRDNRDSNRGGQGGFNRDNRDNNRGGQGGFNRDNNRGGQGRRDERRRDAVQEDFTFEQKPDSRRNDNRRNDRNDRKNQKDRDEKENLKFANQKKSAQTKPVEKEETIKNLILPDVLTIKELADKMKVQPSAVVKKLFLQGKVVTINQEIDYDTAEEIALEFNCICDHEVKVDIIAELLKENEEDEKELIPRPPVVCVMGHVDHGKTSLLDAIRSTNVTAKESGGITQKIGAYMVEINGQKITFLDTPGHEAFTAMRMRGAQSTDIAILVVAADDGVMPQTVEAINHAKAAGIDIIVAVNKIDKPNANIERVKQELTEYELVAEDWGGSTIFCPVSAHTKEGIDNLLEMILLDAEVQELKANPNRKARGLVVEARLDKGKGPVANILVQKGTLHVGDNVAAGSCYGKIRAMTDDKGNKVRTAGPSTPVEVLGLNDVPNAGEIIVATDTDKEARNFAETFIRVGREKLLDDTKAKLSLDDLFSQIQAGNVKELNIIVKADVQGSVEAVKSSLVKLSNEEVVVKIIHGGVGNINESDVSLASASNAIIIGFNVKPDNQAHIVAQREKVDVRLYKVIYNAIEDVEAALKGMLEPKYEEKVTGKIVVRQTYKASGVGVIAGSYVIDGYVTRNASVRLKRGDEELYDGPIASLKRFKDDVKEVKEGFECGIVLEKFNDIQEDDVMEAYEMVEIPR